MACEFSGTVRNAFLKLGHDAVSCDILQTESPGPHIQGNVLDVLNDGWDLMIAHPPCTHLAVSGARHFAEKRKTGVQQSALDFVRALMFCDIPKIAIENPVSIISTKIRKPDQIIQPYHFGHMERKATCLWIKGLPLLMHTNNVYAGTMKLPASQRDRIHHMPPTADRWKKRSITYQGIADAMASQWG